MKSGRLSYEMATFLFWLNFCIPLHSEIRFNMKLVRRFVTVIAAAVMILGCSKVERQSYTPTPTPTPEPDPQPTFQLSQNDSWKIEYKGRTLNEQNRYVEQITVNSVPQSQKYLVSIINRANYATYEGDIAAFLKNEYEYNSEFVYTGSPEVILFDRFRSGTWYGFIIGLDSNENLTGEYAYCKFDVEKEVATDDYKAWLGTWTATDGELTYEITVSEEEPNFVYRVDGWEVRKGVNDWNQMDQEYLETFYEHADGNMYFVSQFIQSYKDADLNNAEVEEYFLGQIDYDGISESQGLYIITDTGLDLACAKMVTLNAANVDPCYVKSTVGSDTFEGPFYGMQYLYTDFSQWYTYNETITKLPVQMKRKSSTQSIEIVPMRNGKLYSVQEEKPRRANLYKASRNVATKAVKVK